MPLPLLGSVAVGGLVDLGVSFLARLTKLFGSYFTMAAVISIYIAMTGLFSNWFMLVVSVLYSYVPPLPPAFLLGLSFFPVTTLITCITFVFVLRASIWIYQLKTSFLINMSKLFYQSVGFK